MKICFVMGSTRISGGTYIIFQHALFLQQQGYEVTIIPQEPFSAHGYKWHPAFDSLNFSDYASEKDSIFDVLIATWWKTIYDLPLLKGRHYVYLVQSVEAWFYPDSEKALRKLVADTYRLPLTVITIADWIGNYLKNKYENKIFIVHNGIRKDIYTDSGDRIAPRKKGKLRVLVEGPLGVDFKNVARTIRLVRKSHADEIWLLTGRPINRYIGVDKVFSMVPVAKTAEIYRACDVIVKLSYIEGMFGPPLEMFHCGGTAIVYDVNGYDQYIKHDQNGLVVTTGDESGVVEAVNRLAMDSALLERLKRGAKETALDWPDWPDCSLQFYKAIRAISKQDHSDRDTINSMIRESQDEYTAITKAEITFLSRIDAFRLRVIDAIDRRFPIVDREKRFLLAWLWESRRLPETRTKD